MTVAALTPSIEYLEDGVTLNFPAPFRFLAGTLKVERIVGGIVTTLTPGSQYSASGGGTDAGGTVTLLATVAGARLRILRDTPLQQQTDYTTTDRFPAESHEQALDRQMLIAQEQEVQIEAVRRRGLLVPDGSEAPPVDIAGLLDGDILQFTAGKLQRLDRAAYAGKFYAGDASGKLMPSSGTGADAGLRTDLATGAGAGLISFADGGTVQDAIETIEPSVWRRRPVAEAALLYPDYAADLVTIGGAYLYPQGFDFDDDGNIYLNTTRNTAGGTAGVIVVYDSDFNYLRRFFRPTAGSESIVVTGSPSGGTLKLYFAVGGNLVEYAPGTMPDNGATLPAATTRITGGCGSIFNYNEGRWLILQLTVDLGIESSRTSFNFYDADFNPLGRFFVAKNVVGWQTSVNAGYPFVPKMQGVTHRAGKVYISTGGSYIPASEPSGPLRAADYGIVEVSADGGVLQYGVCAADLLLSKMDALGYSIERTENEGVTVGPDGELYTLLITKRPSSGDANVRGLVLLKEMDLLGSRWDDAASPYKPAELSRYSGRVWPRSADNKMRDPVSNAEITTMAQLLDLMLDMQLPDASYFTAVHNITPVSGLPTTENWRVDLFNLNNQTVHCRMTSTTSRIAQWFILAVTAEVWGALPLSSAVNAAYLVDGVTAPSARAGYASLYVDSADGDLKVKFGDGTVKTIATDTP